nr:hypothetical protein [Tanacetum cinerariifolium]
MLFTMHETYVDRDPKVIIHFFVRPDSEANVLAEWNALYDSHNEVACLMLESMTPELHRKFENYSSNEMLQELRSMFEKQAGVERFDLIQTFHACKQKKGKSVAAYVLQMKGYVDQLERLYYVLPQDLTVGLILNGLTKDFAKPIISLKAKGKGKANGKKNDKQAYIPKPKNPKLYTKEHPAKDDTCHHCKKVCHCKRNCPAYLVGLIKKKKQVGTATLKEPNITWTLLINGTAVLLIYSKKRIEKLQHEGLLKSTDDESFDQCVFCLSGKMTRKSFPHRPERATDLLGIIHTDVCGPLRHVSRQGASTPKEVKSVQNIPYASGVGSIINPKAELRVDCYCNAGFETDIDDMKYLSRYVLF